MDQVSFAISADDAALRDEVLDRFKEVRGGFGERGRLEYEMDLTACHANGCPIDFDRMAVGDSFSLVHDVIGIERHLNRATGKLENQFLPRFAARSAG